MSSVAVAAPSAVVAPVASTEASAPVSDPTSQGSTPADTAPATYKVGGREYSQADIEAALSTSGRADQILREAAQMKAQHEAALAKVKDPASLRALMKQHGIDEAKLAEDMLIEHLERQSMTPEQIELAELRAERAERAEQAKRAEAEQAARAQEAQVTQIMAAYETQFIEAINASQLPRTAEVGIQLTQIVMDAVDAGYEVTPAEAAVILRARLTEANRSVFEGMTPAQLRAALPEKAYKALIAEHTSGLKAQVRTAPDGQRTAPVRQQRQPSASGDWWSQVTGKPRNGANRR